MTRQPGDTSSWSDERAAHNHGILGAAQRQKATISCILTETKARGWDSDIMLEYVLVITSTQKHGCPSKGTPWALCTQPRPAVWGDFTPVLLIIHTSGPPYFHMHIDMTDWSRFQCHLWALGVDLWVLKAHR